MKNKILISMLALFILQICLVSAFTITNVNVNPDKIAPGQTADLILTIKNTQQADYENVNVNLVLDNLPFSPYQSSSMATIKSIDEDKSKSIEFNIKADSNAKTGIYKIPVIITYNTSKATSVVSVEVSSQPSLQVDSENYLIKGRNNEVNIKIINTGLADIKFLSVQAQETGLNIISSKYVYIGDIDSNDFDTASFSIFASKDASNIINLGLTINYRDSLNKEYQETKQVSLRAYSTDEAVSLGLIQKSNLGAIISFVVILIILYLVYRYIRKRLKKKKEAV